MGNLVRPTHIFVTWVDGNSKMNNYTGRYDGLSVDGKLRMNGHTWSKYIPELPHECLPLSITPLFDRGGIPIELIHPTLVINSILVTGFASCKHKSGQPVYLKIIMDMNVLNDGNATYMRLVDIDDIKEELRKCIGIKAGTHVECDDVIIASIIPVIQNFSNISFPTRIN